MKKSILAVVAVVFLVAIIAATAQRYYYTRYGVFYSYPERYGFYYPFYTYPSYASPSYVYPYYASRYYPPYYYSPLSTEVMYRYGAPTTVYPSYVGQAEPELPRGVEGQLCGVVDSRQYGCVYGLVCDYTQGAKAGVGVCSRQSGSTAQTYPPPSTVYPYYYRYYG